MSWNSKNRAHAALYAFELWHHSQRGATFNDVGSWATDYIIKSGVGGSNELRADNVRAHARLLDEVFTSLYSAKYEVGFNRDLAISSLESMLNEQSKKLSDVGDVVDSAYKFQGEIT